jgi:glycosyltransferase involved in cell wall biosynthesis
MRKIKLLYDASAIVENINLKTANRSGIYWVVYNVLHQFYKSSLYETTLFIPHYYFTGIKRKIKHSDDQFLTSFSFITIYDGNLFKKYIKNHIFHIKSTKNLFIVFIRLLKVFKNLIFLILSKIIRNRLNDYDIFISPVYPVPDIIKDNTSIKSFHILYDCIPIIDNISFPVMDNNHWFPILLQNLNKNTYYFCISECTKKDFLKAAPMLLDESKVFVTPIAASQNFYPEKDKSVLQKVLLKYGIEHKPENNYIFSLCTLDPRKNLIFTMDCYIKFIKKHQINNLYFYLGGGHFKAYISQFQQETLNYSGYTDKIIRLGYVDDEDVNILYSNSLFFTYLSQYEGFGLPPLEAMQAGTPVITSNNSSLPEVVGDAAITIDYNSEEQCIKAFEDLYFNEEIRNKYIEKGLEHAKLFSWEKTFNLMDEFIQSKYDCN